MINDNTVTLLEAFEAFPLDFNDPTGLVTGDHAGLVTLGSLTHMGPIDSADIRSAYGRSFGLDHYLTVTGSGHVKFLHLHSTVARENRAKHLNTHKSYLHFCGYSVRFILPINKSITFRFPGG